MALTDTFYTLAGLCEIELPSRTIRLCDGGLVNWVGRGLFQAEDSEFGTIGDVQAISENVGDEAPMGQMTMLPPSIVSSAALFQPNAQRSPMRFWFAEISPASGLIVGTPELQFSGFIDTVTVRQSRERRVVEITFISEAERLFWTKEGNVLSPRFHKSVWAGELGLDFATGAQIAVPWGVSGPARGTVGVSSSGSSTGWSGAFSSVFR